MYGLDVTRTQTTLETEIRMIDSSVYMLGNEQKETLKHDPPLIMMVPRVERMFGRLATRYNRRRVFFSPGRVVLICCDSVQRTARFWFL